MIRVSLKSASMFSAALPLARLIARKVRGVSGYEPLLDVEDNAVTDLGGEVVMVLAG